VPNELAALKRFAVPLFIVIGMVPTAELAQLRKFAASNRGDARRAQAAIRRKDLSTDAR